MYKGRSLPLNSEPFEDSVISSKFIGSSVEDDLTISKTSFLFSLLTGVPKASRYSMPLLPLKTKITSSSLFIALICCTSDLENFTSSKLIGKLSVNLYCSPLTSSILLNAKYIPEAVHKNN